MAQELDLQQKGFGKKMNILVYDIAASSSGALSILQDFYEQVREQKDTSIHWYFVVSTPLLQETKNITVLSFKWVKKSWLHRIFFEYFIAPELVKTYKIDRIFNMVNILVRRTKIPQILYLQNSIPFSDIHFKLRGNEKYWVYQNIIGRGIKNSVKKCNTLIVQSMWMKKICSKYISNDRIFLSTPIIADNSCNCYMDLAEHRTLFFYPASAFPYKNHKVIVKACEMLKQKGIAYQVLFTLNGNETKLSNQLKEEVHLKKLKITFMGNLSREQVYEYYSKSTLIFPSILETFGLPLLEARNTGSFILAADTLFAREIVGKYENAYFFNWQDAEKLADYMIQIIKNKIIYKVIQERKQVKETLTLMEIVKNERCNRE